MNISNDINIDSKVIDDDSKCICGFDIDNSLNSNLPQFRTCWLYDEKNKKALNKTKEENMNAEINEISNGIYLGNQQASRNLELLNSKGITHILICSKDLIQHFPNIFIYKQIEIEDYPDVNITDKFEEAFKFINDLYIVLLV